MIDTHAHVHDRAFDADREAVLARAREAGVEMVVTVGCDLVDSENAAKIAHDWNLAWTIGVHPHEAKDAPEDIATAFDELKDKFHIAPRAVGETGLDFYYDHSPRDAQVRVLEAQIAYARDRNLPLVFHQRDAFETFVQTLRAHKFDGMRGVVHCFTGTPSEARMLTGEFGLFLGIGGVVTFKTAGTLREAVRSVGIERLILETDAPYLAPVPERGKRNEPAFLAHTVLRLCETLVCDRIELLAVTSRNARELFAL